MKVKKAGAWILTVALTASMLGGCGGGGNSSSASSSTGTAAVEASTADTAASAATEEKTVSADAASTETTDAADAASTEASGENGEVSVAGRYDVVRYNYGAEAEHNDEWMELNADGTGTLCLGEEPFAITYERDESAFNMEGVLDYSLTAEDGTEYSGAFHVDKDVFNVTDNDFNLVMVVKEGTKAYDQFYLGLEVAPDESTVTGHFDGIDAETQEANGDWLELEEGGKGTLFLKGETLQVTYTLGAGEDEGMVYLTTEDGTESSAMDMFGSLMMLYGGGHLSAEELFMSDGSEGESLMFVKEGAEAW